MATAKSSRGRIQVLGGLTVALGAGLLLQPHRLARWICGSRGLPDETIIRILGGRELLQGAVQIAYPEKGLLAGGIAVDVLHLLSMLSLAAVWPTYRRAALASAAMAGISAGAGAAILVSGGSRCTA